MNALAAPAAAADASTEEGTSTGPSARRAESTAALLTASQDDTHLFLVAVGAQCDVTLSETGPGIAELLGGRGGGSGSFFQGRAASLDSRSQALDLLRRAVHG